MHTLMHLRARHKLDTRKTTQCKDIRATNKKRRGGEQTMRRKSYVSCHIADKSGSSLIQQISGKLVSHLEMSYPLYLNSLN